MKKLTQEQEELLHRLEVINESEYFNKKFKKEFEWVSIGLLFDAVKLDIVSDKVITKLSRIVPICYKIGDKLLLKGEDKGAYDFIGDGLDTMPATEIYDMTTEIETGNSYTFYTSSVEYFPLASAEETEKVEKFLESLK